MLDNNAFYQIKLFPESILQKFLLKIKFSRPWTENSVMFPDNQNSTLRGSSYKGIFKKEKKNVLLNWISFMLRLEKGSIG